MVHTRAAPLARSSYCSARSKRIAHIVVHILRLGAILRLELAAFRLATLGLWYATFIVRAPHVYQRASGYSIQIDSRVSSPPQQQSRIVWFFFFLYAYVVVLRRLSRHGGPVVERVDVHHTRSLPIGDMHGVLGEVIGECVELGLIESELVALSECADLGVTEAPPLRQLPDEGTSGARGVLRCS